MKTLQELAEAYAQREDLHTEDGEYTKTTIIDAYKAGAIETLKTTILVLAMQSRANLGAKMHDAIGSLDTNLRDCCNKITEEQILENETIHNTRPDRQADRAGVCARNENKGC